MMDFQVIETVFKYFALINIILGGFSFLFIIALLSVKKNANLVHKSVGSAFIAIASFFISALFSTSAIIYTYLYVKMPDQIYFGELPEAISQAFYYPSVVSFFIGFLFLSVCIGLCGWLFSKKTGIISSIAAIAIFISSFVMAIITFFVL